MKMTAEEILKSYNADPSRENMIQLAHDNECTLQEIGQFLKDAAAENERPEEKPKKKKGGWPKGQPRKRKNVTEAEAPKKDNADEVMIKNEEKEEKTGSEEIQKRDIPKVIYDILMARLNLLRDKRRFLIDSLDEINDEEDEITRFLRG